MKPDNFFSTRDINLACTLITLGFPLLNIDYQIEGEHNIPIGYFLFDKTELLMEAERDYWQDKLVVNPRLFVVNLRGIKAQINNAYKNPRQNLFIKADIDEKPKK